MSIKIAEQQIRKSRKLTLREFPDRDEHISYLEQYVEGAKSGRHKSHYWQMTRLHYIFTGSPDGYEPLAEPPETMAQARADDARRARLRGRG